LHDIGRLEGMTYLVMEYLEGETLAARLERGPLPLEQVFRYAIEIAGALDKAHRQGVTHRDLKPSNIMLTKSGAKLLDFGLAKLNPKAQPSSSVSALPTNVAMTGEGMILGTLQYMAPEQVEGQEADARTDIFALGTIIYEMTTGKKTFEGKSQAGLIAAILERDPSPISSIQPMTPAQLDHVVNRCLAKDPDLRWQAASDVQHELKWISQSAGQPQPDVSQSQEAVSPSRARIAVPVWLVLVIAGLVGLTVWMLKPVGNADKSDVVRLSVALPTGEAIAFSAGPPLAISSDGTQIVYVTDERLYLRAMDSLDARPLAGTEGAIAPFFSPDGQWIGFFAERKLKKVSLIGGAPQILCEAGFGEGGSWGTDGMIYFSPSNIGGIYRVSSSGGTPEELTKLDRGKGEISHRWPQILPGNKAILFTTWTGPGSDEKSLDILILQSREKRRISSGSTGRYVSAGYIVYTHAGSLMALPFELSRLAATTTSPLPLNIEVNELGEGAAYGVSDSGVLGYLSGSQQFERRLVWVDHHGAIEPLTAPLRGYENVSISPDGKFAAVQLQGPTVSIWIYDFARTTLTPFTKDGASQAPLWSPDGKHIAYRGTRSGFRNIYWKASDGTGDEERLSVSEAVNTPVSWSPDGKWLVFAQNYGSAGDTWIMPIDGDRKPQLLQKNANATHFSPDGHWIAYEGSDSGHTEIYVQPFQGPGGRIQISTEGGIEPVWSRDGRELFYMNGDKTMAVDVQTKPAFSAGSPRVLFRGRYQESPNSVSAYDISLDGKQLLKIQPTSPDQARSQINVVINWFEELKRMTAGKR
jgi:serine/threonine-protein kinase